MLGNRSIGRRKWSSKRPTFTKGLILISLDFQPAISTKQLTGHHREGSVDRYIGFDSGPGGDFWREVDNAELKGQIRLSNQAAAAEIARFRAEFSARLDGEKAERENREDEQRARLMPRSNAI
jgi:hypothetical protein